MTHLYSSIRNNAPGILDYVAFAFLLVLYVATWAAAIPGYLRELEEQRRRECEARQRDLDTAAGLPGNDEGAVSGAKSA